MKRFLLGIVLLLAACEPDRPRVLFRCFNPDGAVRFEKAVWRAEPVVEKGITSRDIWLYMHHDLGIYYYVNGPCETTENR